MIISLKQRKIKFKPRIKLNHNIYIIQNICKSYRNSLFQMEDSKPSNLIKVCVLINNAVKKEKKCHVLHGNKRK